jgi:hypothetical protein
MKNFKKNISLTAFFTLLISSNTFAMDKKEDNEPKKKKTSKTKRFQNWVATAGNIILGKEPAPQEKILALQETSFVNLPADMQFKIINALQTTADSSSFMQVAQALSTLARTNKQLNNLINNPNFCLKLIKYYARMFEANDATICSLLRIQAAKTRLAIQNSLINDICTNKDPDQMRFRELVALGIDPYFTDALGGYTPAEECIINYNITGLGLLLSIGVDPEFVGQNGMYLYDLAASRPNRDLARKMMQVLDDAIQKKHALKN